MVIRTRKHEPLHRFANAAMVPIFNGQSAAAHPNQALADLVAIRNRFDTLAWLRLAYVGDLRNVAASLAEAAVMRGKPTHRPREAFLLTDLRGMPV